MKIYEILLKPSEAKKPAWNRAKVSIGAAGWTLSAVSIHAPKLMEVYENTKINEISGNR